MLCGVFNPRSGQSFTAAFVYARNRREERISLWDTILELSASPLIKDSPWIILGDFNQVTSLSEIFTLSTPFFSLQGIEDFNSCISNSEVFDLANRGCHYTWSNKSVSNPKARKLDRALVNESWSNQFPDSYAYFDAVLL